MGGSGGGGYFYSQVNPEELMRKVREAESENRDSLFEAKINGLLADVLGNADERDVEGTQAILQRIKNDLGKEFEGTVEVLFGGSVAKKTYIEGLSDVDALVLLNKSQVVGETPNDVKRKFAERLRIRFGEQNVEEGHLSVTLTVDGKMIQLLPAMRSGSDSFKISNPNGIDWADVRPRKFAEKLTATNRQMEGKLIPTIKLAKTVVADFPEQQQLSGYHCESLAIAAFSGYTGEKTPKAMLHHFFETGAKLVLGPIRDSTGQSVHVDEYLGQENGLKRRIVADALGRIARRIANANAARSPELWHSIVNTENVGGE